MNRFLFLRWALAALASLGALLPARAQTFTADWAITCGSGPSTLPYYWGPVSLAADAQGNTYVIGDFQGTTTLGTTTLTAVQAAPGNIRAFDTFLAKLNAQGQYQWAVQLGDGQSARALQVAVDNIGNVYLTGRFNSYSMQVGAGGPVLYNSSADYEGFIGSFSALDGHCQWARRFGSTATDAGQLLTTNAAGEVYLVASIQGRAADFGPFTLPAISPSYQDRGVLAKLSASGTWLWAQVIGTGTGFSQTYLYTLALDGVGGLYLTGSFASNLTVGTSSLSVNPLADGSPGYDVLVAKYTEAGRPLWAVQGDANNQTAGEGAVYDGQGHLYVAGRYTKQQMRLGSFVLPNASLALPPLNPPPTNPYTRYYSDGFLARLDTTSRSWQWAVRRGGDYDDSFGVVGLAAGGRLLVSYGDGTTNQGFLLEPNLTTGAMGPGYILNAYPSILQFSGLQASAQGRFYAFGRFTGLTATVGGQALTGTSGTNTGFMARLGTQVLATQAPGQASQGLHAWPTPSSGTGVWVQGAQAGQAVEVLDMLGRRVGGGTMPGSGPLRLSWPGAGLAPGVYVVRSGERSTRWVVE